MSTSAIQSPQSVADGLKTLLLRAEAALASDVDAASALLEELGRRAQEAGDTVHGARACELLGRVGLFGNNPEMAQRLFALASELYRGDGDVAGEARALAGLRVLAEPQAFASDEEAIAAELQLVHSLCEHFATREERAPTLAFLVERAVNELRYELAARRGQERSLPRLARLLGLSGVERAVLMAAAGPALDEPLARAMRKAQDDLVARAPSVWFLQELLAPSLPQPPTLRCFEEDAPLRQSELLTLSPHPDRVHGARRHLLLDVDADVVAYLEGRRELAPALAAHAALRGPLSDPLSRPAAVEAQVTATERLLRAGRVDRIVVVGPAGAGKKSVAARLAHSIHRRALVVDLGAAFTNPQAVPRLLRLAAREARLHEAALVLDLQDGAGRVESELRPVIGQDAGPLYRAVSRNLGAQPVFVCARDSAVAAPLLSERSVELVLPALTFDEQVRHMQRALQQLGAAVPAEGTLRAVVCQAGTTPGLIQRIAAHAVALSRLGASELPQPTLHHLREAARAHTTSSMGSIAQRVSTPFTLGDLVAPPETVTQLREIINYVRNYSLVYESWGFARKVAYGRSVTCLFTGPPGTGKTMAASVIAAELGMDLFRIDLSKVVSKYIGETEKNLERVFEAAGAGQLIVLFDEADALFGKRTEVKNSNDRYANLEVNYLLQRIEAFEGIAILTTNLEKNIDEAFRRRLRFLVEFPFPTVEERERLWRTLLPERAKVRGTIPFEELAEFELAGGNISSAVLRAAFSAAARGDALLPYDLVRGAVTELEKMGRLSMDTQDLFRGLELPPGVRLNQPY
jgi:AAA+ superfamily predicted ATPase